ncbi:MAG TPA: pyruvate formate lyase family protein [Polyangia bacterium]
MTAPAGLSRLWGPSPELPARVRRLRDEYFAYETRRFHNEVLPLTTGTPWDVVWSPLAWTNVPELHPFLAAFEDSLRAAARPVRLPAGFWDEPLIVRAALFFAAVLRGPLPVDILDDELIVGGHFCVALSRCLTRAEARERAALVAPLSAEIVRTSGLGVGNCGAVPGHLVPDYRRVLEVGFVGLAAELKDRLGAARRPDERAALRAFLIAVEAVPALAARYAARAAELAGAASGARRAELLEIARICAKVPWQPPATLHEALQALWLTHMLVMVAESYPGPGVSFGRLDQMLLPFYERDVAAGRLDRARAKELLECFWIKPNYAYDYQARLGRNQGINSSFGQLVTLGGCGPRGVDRSNDLTWLMLEVIEELNLLEPKPNVRLHANTPAPLLERVAAMCAAAQGAPVLLNFDEAAMAGLKWAGLPEAELWDYAPVGCLENTRQGDDRSGTVDVNLNLAKAVELALFQGRDLRTGAQLGPRTPDPLTFRSYEDLWAAFRRQLRWQTHALIELADRADAVRARFEPTPYLSALVGGCAERGRDVTNAGARFNFITVEGVALATAVDSLNAVKKLCFEDGRVPMGELVTAVRAGFTGHELTRQVLLNKAPKYGNDDPAADGVAREVSRFWTEEVFHHRTASGRRFRGGYLSWNYGIAYAPSTAATPDGRRRGTYLSNGVAAVNGADHTGPTAAARSVRALGLETAPGGDSHTISLSPALTRDPEHIAKLAAFLRAYGRDGGTALQVNIVDAATLRAAQANPEEYRNLLVRVTGYNAYFVHLGREMQDEIIARESHGT